VCSPFHVAFRGSFDTAGRGSCRAEALSDGSIITCVAFAAERGASSFGYLVQSNTSNGRSWIWTVQRVSETARVPPSRPRTRAPARKAMAAHNAHATAHCHSKTRRENGLRRRTCVSFSNCPILRSSASEGGASVIPRSTSSSSFMAYSPFGRAVPTCFAASEGPANSLRRQFPAVPRIPPRFP